MRTLKTNAKRAFDIGDFVRIAGKSYMVDSDYQRPDTTASHQAWAEWKDRLRLAVEYMAEVTTELIVVVETKSQTLICYAPPATL